MVKTVFTIIAALAALSSFAQDSTTNHPDAEAYGAIKIISTPSDADIFLNGRETGEKTPALLTNLKAGLNTVEITLPEYLFAKRQVNIIPDSVMTISFELIMLSDTAHIIGDLQLGILSLPRAPIHSPYLVDNKQVYSQEITLNAGLHHLVWEGGNRYSSLDTIIEIFAGKLTTFSFSPERMSGKLAVDALPRDADIYLNNSLYGAGAVETSLYTGPYTLVIRRNGYYTYEKQIVIAPAKYLKLDVVLDAVPDRDRDGFLDSVDLCPDDYGLYCGCPKQNRREALRTYRKILGENLRNQRLAFSINTAGYLYRKPTSTGFSEFISYFNDGSSFCNNKNGLILANTYTAVYKGVIICCELGQWFSPLEYKKANYSPVAFKTAKDEYCLYFDTMAQIAPTISIPSTALSIGFNLSLARFHAAYLLGHQWEDIIIRDIIPRTPLEAYLTGDSSVTDPATGKYTGPRTVIIFNNNWWFHKLLFEFDLMVNRKPSLSLYTTVALSFSTDAPTGWHSFQAGLLYRFFPSLKRNRKK